MLVALREDERIEAGGADRGPGYACPLCRGAVVLKRGRIVVPHFAHKPPRACSGWTHGETWAHLGAKLALRDALAARGLRAEVEHPVDGLAGDRRADVAVWSPSGRQVAIELQHTGIGLEELERRAFAYAAAGVAQMWLPFLRPGVREAAERRAPGVWVVERYPARPWERWVHGFNYGRIWYYDPDEEVLWRGRLAAHELWVKGARRLGRTVGPPGRSGADGCLATARRWRELTLCGPYRLHDLRIGLVRRRPRRMGVHRYPGGCVARFVASEPAA